jgi:phosphatidylglycerophosphate synthase
MIGSCDGLVKGTFVAHRNSSVYETVYTAVSAPTEKRLVAWIAARLPAFVTPNRLTALGVGGACLCFASYILASFDRYWLGLALVGLVIHWFGDSLDGTVARLRRIERPIFGAYLDQTCDAVSVCLILLGIGLSPYVHLDIAALLIVACLALALQAQFRAGATGVYEVALGGVGGTEARLGLMAITGGMMAYGSEVYATPLGKFAPFDGLFALLALWGGVTFAREAIKTLRLLATQDPPKYN